MDAFVDRGRFNQEQHQLGTSARGPRVPTPRVLFHVRPPHAHIQTRPHAWTTLRVADLHAEHTFQRQHAVAPTPRWRPPTITGLSAKRGIVALLDVA